MPPQMALTHIQLSVLGLQGWSLGERSRPKVSLKPQVRVKSKEANTGEKARDGGREIRKEERSQKNGEEGGSQGAGHPECQ